METELETILISCLDSLDRGATVEAVLARYPARAGELRPMLMAAAALADPGLAPARGAQAASRRAFLTEAALLRASGAAAPQAAGLSPGWRRAALRLGGLALGLTLVAATVYAGAEASLPGDALYIVKRTVERARLEMAPDAAVRAAIERRLDERRIDEINQILALGREADVTFTGIAEPAGKGRWRVEGVAMEVGAETRVLGDLEPGEHIHVIGRAADGRVRAATVICVDDLPNWSPHTSPSPLDLGAGTMTPP